MMTPAESAEFKEIALEQTPDPFVEVDVSTTTGQRVLRIPRNLRTVSYTADKKGRFRKEIKEVVGAGEEMAEALRKHGNCVQLDDKKDAEILCFYALQRTTPDGPETMNCGWYPKP